MGIIAGVEHEQIESARLARIECDAAMSQRRADAIHSLLAIIDRHVGYSSHAEQEDVRAARELL